MNLVIDDAVEVKQITKTNDKESRRSLGMMGSSFDVTFRRQELTVCRANPIEGGQRVADSEPFVMGGSGHKDGPRRAGGDTVDSIPSIWHDRGQAVRMEEEGGREKGAAGRRGRPAPLLSV